MIRALVLAAALALGACASGGGAGPSGSVAQLAPVSPAAFWDCVRRSGGTLVSAHRGGPGPGYAENALPTLRRMAALGPVALEVDIRRSRDGVLVLMHDDTLDRTTTGRGPVSARTAAELRRLQLRDPAGQTVAATVPTLAEALAWARGRTVLQLDVKRGVPFEEVVAAVRAAGAAASVVVITYTLEDAITVHRLDRTLMLSVSIDDPADLDRLAAAGVDQSRVLAWTDTQTPNPALYAGLAERGVEVLFGTLGREDSFDARFAREGDRGYALLAQLGVHMIATDRPDAAFRALGPGAVPPACLTDR